MQIILGADNAPHRSRYQAGIGCALTEAWTEAGHAVINTSGAGLAADAAPARQRFAADELLGRHPDARIHLLTTGPVARAIAAACVALRRPFTSSSDAATVAVHQQSEFADSIDAIHAFASRVITPARAGCDLLQDAGVTTGLVVRPGVDTDTFQPRVYNYLDLPRPLTLMLGAPLESPELREFLDTPLPGSRIVYAPEWTGDQTTGPVHFFGYLPPAEIARLISAADVCVIPGTGPETVVLSLQSLACGVPVAARASLYLDELLSVEVGSADDDLGTAVTDALDANRQICRSIATRHSWRHTAHRILKAGGPQDREVA
jgi:glycosyltransferase involved in cell wall biosynthesis